MNETAEQSSAESDSDTNRFSFMAGLAVVLSPIYGVIAITPVLEMYLLALPPAVPLLAGGVLGVIVPIGFRVWQSRDHARRSIKFVFIASPVTYAVLLIMHRPVPWVRGAPMAVLDVGLAIIGAAGLALAITWSHTVSDKIFIIHD